MYCLFGFSCCIMWAAVGMTHEARSRVGNNVGVESEGVDAVFIDMPVILLLPLFLAREEPEDVTFLAASWREYLIRNEQTQA
jgi:hypothetical protein